MCVCLAKKDGDGKKEDVRNRELESKEKVKNEMMSRNSPIVKKQRVGQRVK